MRQFAAQILPRNAKELVIGTSRTTYIEDLTVGATMHSYCGANPIDLFIVFKQYPALNLRSVCIVTGISDHHYSCSPFIECYRILLDIISYNFWLVIVVLPKMNATSINELLNRKIYYMNLTLHRFLQFYTIPLIISPFFFFRKSPFCQESIHFFFYVKHLFSLYLHRVILFCNEISPYFYSSLSIIYTQ